MTEATRRRRHGAGRARARFAALALAAVAVGGCAIQPDSAPRDIPAEERGQLDPVAPGAEATGQSRIYLVAGEGSGGRQELRTVLRDVEPQAPEPVLQALIAGPNRGELDNGMSSPLPPSTTLHSARLVAGTLNVDISAEILDLSGPAVRLAVAQIVFTASELDGVRTVRLRVDGQSRDWPDGRGELQSAPLSVYDYPDVAESAQPPFPPIPSEEPDA
jgi:spore germination protein GerM